MSIAVRSLAVVAREEADMLLKDAKTALAALGQAKKKHKVSSVMGSNQAASPIDGPQSWKTWTLDRFRKHETEIAKRRAVDIDRADTDEEPPPRGEEGWRHHPRRGLVGGVKDWLDKIVLLCELIVSV